MTTPTPVRRSPVPVAFEPQGAVTRLGLIALATDLTLERNAVRLIPATSAALHVTRVVFDNPTTPENLLSMGPRLTEAAALILPGMELAAIGYGCTAASVVIGSDAVRDAIQAARPGVPVATPPDAALAAFAALGVRRIALLTPYLPETTAPMVTFFAAQGLEVVSAHCLGIEDDRDMARVTSDVVSAAAEAADAPEAEAVFLSCTALPALGLIEALEARLGKPVVSANQALLWRLLHYAGMGPLPGAWGRLFDVAPPESPA
jgi:maleate isomerase